MTDANRRSTTADYAIRTSALDAAATACGPGTPMNIVLAEALLAERYLREGGLEQTILMRQIKDQMDQREIAEYLGMMNKSSAVATAEGSEEEHSGEIDGEPVVISDTDFGDDIPATPEVDDAPR